MQFILKKAKLPKMEKNYAAGVAIKKHKPDAVIEMSGNEVNMRSEKGDVDLIVDGVKTEVKSPQKDYDAVSIRKLITSNKSWTKRQANDYVIHFTKEPEEKLLKKLKNSLKYSKSLGVKYKILSNKKYEDLYEN